MNEEIAKAAREYLITIMKLMKRESDTCMHCGAKVEAMQQDGRCVYGVPCGCRLYQGLVPDEWKKG